MDIYKSQFVHFQKVPQVSPQILGRNKDVKQDSRGIHLSQPSTQCLQKDKLEACLLYS